MLNLFFYHPSIINKKTVQFLIKHHDGSWGHNTNLKKGCLGFGLLHYSFITTLHPKRILCVGSTKGFIPAVCAIACKDNGRGYVDFVDAGLDKNEEGNWGGIGFWKKVNPEKHFSALKLNKYITTYVMTTEKFAKKFKCKYEYIYIDGNHSYKGVEKDYKLFWPRLKKGGIISFHDIKKQKVKYQGKEYQVYKLWNKIKKKKNAFSFSCNYGGSNVGFIQKT